MVNGFRLYNENIGPSGRLNIHVGLSGYPVSWNFPGALPMFVF